MTSIKMCCRLRSNIPPPAPEADLGAAVREPEKSRIAVDSIKLSLDGVTNQFRKTGVFGKGLVYVSCVVFG